MSKQRDDQNSPAANAPHKPRLFHASSGIFFHNNSQLFSRPRFNAKYVDEPDEAAPRDAAKENGSNMAYLNFRHDSTDSSASPPSTRSASVADTLLTSTSGGNTAAARSSFMAFFQGGSSRRSSRVSSLPMADPPGNTNGNNPSTQNPSTAPPSTGTAYSAHSKPLSVLKVDTGIANAHSTAFNAPMDVSPRNPSMPANAGPVHGSAHFKNPVANATGKHGGRMGKKTVRKSTLLNKLMPSRKESSAASMRESSVSRSATAPVKHHSSLGRLNLLHHPSHGSDLSLHSHPHKHSAPETSTGRTPPERSRTGGSVQSVPAPYEFSINLDLDTGDEEMSQITKSPALPMIRLGSAATLPNSTTIDERTQTPPPKQPTWMAPESWKVIPENTDGARAYGMGRSTSGMSLSSWSSSTSSSVLSVDNLNEATTPKDSLRGLRKNERLRALPISPNTSITNNMEDSSNSNSSTSHPPSRQQQQQQQRHHHHHHGFPEPKNGVVKKSSPVRIFIGDKSSMISCEMDTTCQNMLGTLRHKRFLRKDDDYIIVLKCGGLTRILSYDERPLKIQRNLLFLYGYTERDNFDSIELTDLSFLFKFIVQDRGVQTISDEKRGLIDHHNVDLVNWNLQDIPNFLYAEPIVSLDVSRNPSFEFTREFMHDCRNLQSLRFTHSGHPSFPTPAVCAPRLANLDLQVNYIRLIPPEISQLSHLSSLNLACNRISRLPDSFAQLQHLRTLNLSSNRLKQIPDQILAISSLRNLDLSYNAIASFDEKLAQLTSLEVLQVAANKLKGPIPDFFQDFKHLIKVDIRFNQFSSMDALKDSPKLEVIRATGNNISVFTSNATTLFEVEMNLNPLTYVYFESPMPNLKMVDFSKGKLTTCSFVAMLTGAETLVLDYNQLSSLPDDICKMEKLVRLSVFKNLVDKLPDSIGSMTNLKHLDLHMNNLSFLNPQIWNLSSLEYLNVSTNLLGSFPDLPRQGPDLGIEALKEAEEKKAEERRKASIPLIERERMDATSKSAPAIVVPSAVPQSRTASQKERDQIDAEKMELKSILQVDQIPLPTSTDSDVSLSPNRMGRRLKFKIMDTLKFLSVNDNKLGDGVIQKVSQFHNLEYLNLSYNNLYDISPGYLSKLHRLRALYLSGNNLSSLPVEDFDSFGHLKILHLNGNKFHGLPIELSKIHNLTALDVGSNNLRYNIYNFPYDWNWCYNKRLQYLNFSGNKRFEIKQQHKRDDSGEHLDSFIGLKDLHVLGLMDVTLTTDALPDQTVNVRVRSTPSQLGRFGYGISDTLGTRKVISTRDVVMEKFRGHRDEMLITLYDGKNCSQTRGDKISKIIQETFDIHFREELEKLGDIVVPGGTPKTIEDCLRKAFLTMNSEMNILINKDSSTFSSAAAHRTQTTDELSMEEDGSMGCCATIIYIKGDELYIANLGDIMGIATTSDGGNRVITTKHEPYAQTEYDRIRQSGGYVTTDGYLDGVSEVSRAVGFFSLIPHITAQPSIQKIKLSAKEEMIALATSNVWKKVPYDFAANLIRQEKSNPGVAAEKLRDFAIAYGVKDKATAIVLSLKQFNSESKRSVKDMERGSQPEDSMLSKFGDEIPPPTGEVTMVFTDIKNSTLLWDTYPIAMRSAIKVHNAIMRQQMRIIGGYEVKVEGDAFMASFPTMTSALLWCFRVQFLLLETDEWPAEILSSDQGCEIKDQDNNVIFRGLSVRMGVHWGTPVCERDVVTKRMDYFGPMVNRASRVSAVADGGQITMSNDFYQEFHKLERYHHQIQDQHVSIESLYQSKAVGMEIESELTELDEIGWVEKSVGSKKLKGLEAPEKIYLIYPAPLKARMAMLDENNQSDTKSTKLAHSGITVANMWTLREVALRLERICNYLSAGPEPPVDAISPEKLMDIFSPNAEGLLSKQFSRSDMTSVFFGHVITRIENCIMTLSIRMAAGQNGLLSCGNDQLMAELTQLIGSVKSTMEIDNDDSDDDEFFEAPN